MNALPSYGASGATSHAGLIVSEANLVIAVASADLTISCVARHLARFDEHQRITLIAREEPLRSIPQASLESEGRRGSAVETLGGRWMTPSSSEMDSYPGEQRLDHGGDTRSAVLNDRYI
jgi:hypothetical protein